MLKKPNRPSSTKSSFVPRSAFGRVGLGVSVLPLLVACTTDSSSSGTTPIADASIDADAAFTGILPAIPDASVDAGADADAAFTGVLPYSPPDGGLDADADVDGHAGDAAPDAEEDGSAQDGSTTDAADASGD